MSQDEHAFNRGDIVTIRPESQDPGDDAYLWVVRANQDGPKVMVSGYRKSENWSIQPVFNIAASALELLIKTQLKPIDNSVGLQNSVPAHAIDEMIGGGDTPFPLYKGFEPQDPDIHRLVRISPFMRGYIAAALSDARTTVGSGIDASFDLTAIPLFSLNSAYNDCQSFFLQTTELIEAIKAAMEQTDDVPYERFGALFYRYRNAEAEENIGDANFTKLSAAARQWGRETLMTDEHGFVGFSDKPIQTHVSLAHQHQKSS